jgi:hypothetical protein
MGINNLSACVCVGIKYVTIEQLYIEPLVYKNKSICVCFQQAQVVHN